MRYIKKNEEPKSLTQYKKNQNAYFDGFSEKDDVREALLKENERQALNYKIMAGVCYGNAKKGREHKSFTCDAHRGNQELHVTPFDLRCIEKIKYASNGEILSEDEQIKDSLDKVLNLNYDGPDAYLMKNRAAVLQACKTKLSKLQRQGIWDRKVLQKMLEYYEWPDSEGKLLPYSGIAIWYLKKKLKML